MGQLIKFNSQIILVCALGFIVHVTVLQFLNLPLFDNQIIVAYVGNIILAIVIVIALLKAPPKYQNSLGFLFLLGSFLKFGFFFLVFYSNFKANGTIERPEFFAFFTPYAVALTMEAKCLINNLSE